MIKVNHGAANVSEFSILISGSARSGTTILGKILGSCRNVEYFFEPPLLFSLFANAGSLDPLMFNELFNSYVHDDLCVNSLAGRNLNFRVNDDSCIFNYKSKAEVDQRLLGSNRKRSVVKKTKVVIKVPDFVYKEVEIAELLPNLTVVRIIRDPYSTINSLIARGWFSDENIKRCDLVWPSHQKYDYFLPHWLPVDIWDDWPNLSEADRCAHYYLCQISCSSKPKALVDYSRLMLNAVTVLDKLFDILDLETTEKTYRHIESVRLPDTANSLVPIGLSPVLGSRCQNEYESEVVDAL